MKWVFAAFSVDLILQQKCVVYAINPKAYKELMAYFLLTKRGSLCSDHPLVLL